MKSCYGNCIRIGNTSPPTILCLSKMIMFLRSSLVGLVYFWAQTSAILHPTGAACALSFIYRTAIPPELASYMVFGRVLMLLLLNLMGYKVKRWARFRCLGLYKASSIVVIVRQRLRASFFFTLWDEAWKPICHRHKTVTMNHVKMALANTNVRQDAPEQHLQQQSSQTQYSF